MHSFIRQLFSGAIIAAAALAPQAYAQQSTITFNNPGVANIYLPGDSFTDGAYTITQQFEVGIVTSTPALDLPYAPTGGDGSAIYATFNDAQVGITRTDGGAFDLNGFSAAFLPLDPTLTQTIAIVAFGIPIDDPSAFVYAYATISYVAGGSNPFLTFSGIQDMTNLQEVDFFACALSANGLCADLTRNNAQFALDNVVVTAVPEPTTTALMALGLIGLVVLRRRAAR